MRRVLIKLSGEALAIPGEAYDRGNVEVLADKLIALAEKCELAVIIGGGNIIRGRSNAHMDRVCADHMGMMVTVMNALAVGDAIARAGGKAEVFSALLIERAARPYMQSEAGAALSAGAIVLLGGGTGLPYVSTDTAAVVRALELKADMILCAKNVDGVYDSDPASNPRALRYDVVTCNEIIRDNLKALDIAAVALMREYRLPAFVFHEACSFTDALDGLVQGTKIV